MGRNQFVRRGQDKGVAGEGRGMTVQGSHDGHRHPSQKVQDQNPAFALCP